MIDSYDRPRRYEKYGVRYQYLDNKDDARPFGWVRIKFIYRNHETGRRRRVGWRLTAICGPRSVCWLT